VKTKEDYLERAKRLRAALAVVDDPLASKIIKALIDACEEAAQDVASESGAR
jgi:hypothetical protein